jgi:hypothetical protein
MLVFFRRNLMFSYRQRLSLELRQYLLTTHGSAWACWLWRWRCQQRLRKGVKRPISIEGGKPGRERQRRGVREESEENLDPFVRDVTWQQGAFGKKSSYVWRKGPPSRKFKEVKDPAAALTDIQELVKDAEVGHDILRKAVQSDWWNWSGGSTLIYWRWPAGLTAKVCPRWHAGVDPVNFASLQATS